MDTTTLNGREVKQVYSGKPGCACGCKGKHTKRDPQNLQAMKTIARHVATIKQLIADGAKPDTDENYVAVQTESRLYIAYFS